MESLTEDTGTLCFCPTYVDAGAGVVAEAAENGCDGSGSTDSQRDCSGAGRCDSVGEFSLRRSLQSLSGNSDLLAVEEPRSGVVSAGASPYHRASEACARRRQEGMTEDECTLAGVVPVPCGPAPSHEESDARAPSSGRDAAGSAGETCSPPTAQQVFVRPAASVARGFPPVEAGPKDGGGSNEGNQCDWRTHQSPSPSRAVSPPPWQGALDGRRLPLPTAEQKQRMAVASSSNGAGVRGVENREKRAEARGADAASDSEHTSSVVTRRKSVGSVGAFSPELAKSHPPFFPVTTQARGIVDRTAARSRESVCCARIGRVASIPTPSSAPRAVSPAARFIAAAAEAIASEDFSAEEMPRGSAEGLQGALLPVEEMTESKRHEERREGGRASKPAADGRQGKGKQLCEGPTSVEGEARCGTTCGEGGVGTAGHRDSDNAERVLERGAFQQTSAGDTARGGDAGHSRVRELGVFMAERSEGEAPVEAGATGEGRESGGNSSALFCAESQRAQGDAVAEPFGVAGVPGTAASAAPETTDEATPRRMPVTPNRACHQREEGVAIDSSDCACVSQKHGGLRDSRNQDPGGFIASTTAAAKADFCRSLSEVYLSSLLQPTEMLLNRTAALVIGVLMPAVYVHVSKWFHNCSARRDWTSDQEFRYSCSSSSCSASVASSLVAPTVDLLPVFFSSAASSPAAVEGMDPGAAAGVAVPPVQADDVAHFVFRVTLAPEKFLRRILLFPVRRKTRPENRTLSLEAALCLRLPASADTTTDEASTASSPDLKCTCRQSDLCPGVGDGGESLCCFDSLLPFPVSLPAVTSAGASRVPVPDHAYPLCRDPGFSASSLSSPSPGPLLRSACIPDLSFRGPPPCWCFIRTTDTERSMTCSASDSLDVKVRSVGGAPGKEDMAPSCYGERGKRPGDVSVSNSQPGHLPKRRRLQDRPSPSGREGSSVTERKAEMPATKSPLASDVPASALASFLSEEVPATVYGFHVSKLLAAGARDAAIALTYAQQSESPPFAFPTGRRHTPVSWQKDVSHNLDTSASPSVFSVEEPTEDCGPTCSACIKAPSDADQTDAFRLSRSLFWSPVSNLDRLLCRRDPPSRTRPIKNQSAIVSSGHTPNAAHAGALGGGGSSSAIGTRTYDCRWRTHDEAGHEDICS